MFILGPSDAPTAGFLYFYKIQFGAASVNWSYVLSATGGSNSFYCESLLSADTTMIYSFFIFGITTSARLYFYTFMVADGSISGTRYQSFGSTGDIYGAVQNGNYICVLSQTTSSTYMVVVNIVTNAISVYGAGSRLYGITVEPSTGMYIVVGQYGSSGYKTNFYIGNIGLNAGFYLQTWTLTALAAGNYDVTSYTASISAVATLTVSSPVYTNVSTIVITSSVTNSNILMPTSALAYSFSPTQSGSFAINIPCISGGLAIVAYSISNYGAGTAPSWISINSSTGVLTISSASIIVNQVFSFYVNSVFTFPSSATIQTVVSLTSDCVIQNCLLSTSSASNCIVCGTGYSLTSGNCGLISAATGGSTSSNSGASNSSNPTSSSSSSASNIPFILNTTLQSLFALTIGNIERFDEYLDSHYELENGFVYFLEQL